MEGEALAECGIWVPRWEDEMISLYRGTCRPPHQPPCPSRVAKPREPGSSFACMWDSKSSLNMYQVQANCEAWKAVSWGWETSLFLCMLSSGRALSEVRWCGAVALKVDVICAILKNVTLNAAPPCTPAITLLCLVDITFLPRAAFQNEVLVNSSWAFIR